MKADWGYRVGRRRNILVIACIMLIGLLASTSVAVEVGYVYFVKSDLQARADAAALAGASGLGTSSREAIRRAKRYAQKNTIVGSPVSLQDRDVQMGLWDSTTHVFTPVTPSATVIPYAVRVAPWLSQARGNPVKLFFASAVSA